MKNDIEMIMYYNEYGANQAEKMGWEASGAIN